MLKFIIKRLLMLILQLFVISLIIFIVLSIVPGDPARAILGITNPSPEDYMALRKELGLDEPLHIRYSRFIWNALHGDLGHSYITRVSVMSELSRRSLASLGLATAAMTVSLLVGIPIGIIAAIKNRSKTDYFIRVCVGVSISMPIFWLGLLLMQTFAVSLRLLPTSGYGNIRYWVLPVTTLSIFMLTLIIPMTKSCMLEVLDRKYIRTARAKGLTEKTVLLKHALKNALIPVVSVTGTQLGSLIGSSILTETIFAWPGLGRLTVEAVSARDIPVIQGCVLTMSATFVIINLIVDILYTYLDPRIRYG